MRVGSPIEVYPADAWLWFIVPSFGAGCALGAFVTYFLV